MNIVLNATPLVYLGKKRKTDLLRLVFEKIIIPPEVEEEVMSFSESPEAVQLRDAINEGWIVVETASEEKAAKIARLFPEIDKGEAAVIALAIERQVKSAIIDDAEARVAAEYFNLEVHGTLYVMLEALKRNILKSKTEVRSILDNMLRRGFYLSTEVYSEFLSLLEKVE
nr:DUF3368 domain-containing protein [Candidatus Freyarchaeota archaeon]